MWTLVLVFYLGSSLSVTKVEGYKSRNDCQSQATKLMVEDSKGWLQAYCIEVPK